jgi:hypothetical protein
VHPSAEESYEVIEGAIEVFMDGSWKTTTYASCTS